jgi:outer membrane murein-binding lipoprotein Lpp
MAAEVAFLEEVASIEKISDNELGPGAKDLRNELEKLQEDIEVAREDVDALALAAGEPLAPANELLTSVIDASEGVLVESDRALAEWQAEVYELQAQGEGALQEAQTYQDSMSSLMDQYFQQRDETRALVERDRVFFTEASQQLRAMAAARGSIISQMQALTVPPGAETAHSTMVSLASRSRDILEQAATTTETDPFPIWTGSPGYQQLNSASDQISAEYDPAREGVLTAAEQAVQDAQSQDDLPPKPKL